MKGKKGTVTLYIVTMISAILILIIASVFAPMGVLLNTKLYASAEDIYLRANESIGDIQDAEVRARVYGMIDAGLEAQENNIEVNADLFQYSWIFVLVLTGIISFLYTRRLVETTGGFV